MRKGTDEAVGPGMGRKGCRIHPSDISDFLVCLYYAVPLKIAWRERWGVGVGGGGDAFGAVFG